MTSAGGVQQGDAPGHRPEQLAAAGDDPAQKGDSLSIPERVPRAPGTTTGRSAAERGQPPLVVLDHSGIPLTAHESQPWPCIDCHGAEPRIEPVLVLIFDDYGPFIRDLVTYEDFPQCPVFGLGGREVI